MVESATVASGQELSTSPISGAHGVFFLVEVLEDDRVLGDVMFGDLARLVIDGTTHTVRVRDIRLAFADTRPSPTPFHSRPPAELVPWLARASGKGVLGWREHVVRIGDRFRVRSSPQATPLLLDVVTGV